MSDLTPWTAAYQAPVPMGFSRQEYLSELPFPSSGDLPHPGIKLGSPTLQADTLLPKPPAKPMKKKRRRMGMRKFLKKLRNNQAQKVHTGHTQEETCQDTN